MQSNKIITSTELDPMAKMRQELEEIKSLRADLAKEKQADAESKRIALTEDDLADVLVSVQPHKRPGSNDDIWLITVQRDRFKASDVSAYFRNAYKLPLHSVFVKYQEHSHANQNQVNQPDQTTTGSGLEVVDGSSTSSGVSGGPGRKSGVNREKGEHGSSTVEPTSA